jgi:hypothetical protein
MAESQQHQQRKQKTVDSKKKPNGKGKGHQQGRFHCQGNKHKKKDPDVVPTLKYGLGNNLMRFKEALSKRGLEE